MCCKNAPKFSSICVAFSGCCAWTAGCAPPLHCLGLAQLPWIWCHSDRDVWPVHARAVWNASRPPTKMRHVDRKPSWTIRAVINADELLWMARWMPTRIAATCVRCVHTQTQVHCKPAFDETCSSRLREECSWQHSCCMHACTVRSMVLRVPPPLRGWLTALQKNHRCCCFLRPP